MSFTISIGTTAPSFKLSATDGKWVALEDFAKCKVIVLAFTCNHCPTAIANEDRLIALQGDFAARGVQVVAINSNDTKFHPDDSFTHMIERAKTKGFNFPYLRDESQDIAKNYGAQRTPHFFVLNEQRQVVYEGALDDNPHDGAGAEKHYVRDAVVVALASQAPSVATTPSHGCNVKWRGKDAHWTPTSRVDF